MGKFHKLMRGIAALGIGAAAISPGVAQADPAPLEPPVIIPREVWGAREPRCQWDGTDGSKVTHVVIHHSYEPTDPPSLESAYAAIRHIQNLHMDDNGWCDVGYSYLVDWFGNVYEGTKGATQRPITSAHTAGLNYEGVGIVMIGNYQEEVPSAQTVAAAGRVAGWVLGWYGYEAEQDTHLTVGGGNNKWSRGTNITVPIITAHRDVVTTECPGDGGYSVLGEIRLEASRMTSAMQASGDFGAGVGNSASIFAVGTEPTVPIGVDAQDADQVAEEAGLVLAHDEADDAAHVSETAPATEPDDGDDADVLADEPVVDPGVAAENATLNLWWWAAVAVFLGLLAWMWWRRFRRPTATRWEDQAEDVAEPEEYLGDDVDDAVIQPDNDVFR